MNHAFFSYSKDHLIVYLVFPNSNKRITRFIQTLHLKNGLYELLSGYYDWKKLDGLNKLLLEYSNTKRVWLI